MTERAHRWTRDDVRGTLAALGPWWRQLVDRRPDPGAARMAVAGDLDAALHALRPDVAPSPDAWQAMDEAGEAAAAALPAGPVRPADVAVAVEQSARVADAASRLRAAGLLGSPAVGVVAALHAGPGGVPKPPVERATIDRCGLVGDRQATRRHHGRPFQAVCLWSDEVIEGLRAEGHPVGPGSAGENVLVTGIPWEQVTTGVRLWVGTALLEVSLFALPCRTVGGSFLGRRFDRIHHDNGPVSRLYASVVEPGEVRAGDRVSLEP